jgi:hypothetical protein
MRSTTNKDIVISGTSSFAYIRPDCTAAPSPGPCFESLAAWHTANGGLPNKDLVSQSLSHTAIIQGDWSIAGPDTSIVDFSPWNADATNTLTITAEGLARHSGVVAASNYILQGVQPAATGIIIAGSDYTTFDGFIVDGTNATGSSSERF